MQRGPRDRERELYIKADSRAPSSSVKRVLEGARAVRFSRVFLLTATPAGTPPKIAAPAGIPLWLAQPGAAAAIVVQISDDHGLPVLKIDKQQVPLNALQHKLVELLLDQNDNMVVLKADDVPFADLAHVVDVCNMAGARAVVVKN